HPPSHRGNALRCGLGRAGRRGAARVSQAPAFSVRRRRVARQRNVWVSSGIHDARGARRLHKCAAPTRREALAGDGRMTGKSTRKTARDPRIKPKVAKTPNDPLTKEESLAAAKAFLMGSKPAKTKTKTVKAPMARKAPKKAAKTRVPSGSE